MGNEVAIVSDVIFCCFFHGFIMYFVIQSREASNFLFIVAGLNAASLSTAQSYISAFSNLAQKNNTVILPANVSDVTGVVGSAVAIYQNLAKKMQQNEVGGQAIEERDVNQTTYEDSKNRGK